MTRVVVSAFAVSLRFARRYSYFEMDLLNNILEVLGSHPLLVFMILYVVYSKWKASQPWPDYGGRLTSIHSVDEWSALLRSAAQSNQLVVVDCYATWCPPCRVAAPAFARMSEKYDARFAKVDVDEASELQALLRVSVLPTFKIFRPAAPAFRAASTAFFTTDEQPFVPRSPTATHSTLL